MMRNGLTWVNIVLILLCSGWSLAQSPHGKDLTVSCESCHTAESWSVNRDSISFDHQTTKFLLEGQHAQIDCRLCHISLVFSAAENKCASCHLDIHQETVGQECARCHNTNSWLINEIADLHRSASFPLLGQHAVAACTDCHRSETELRFTPIGVECIDCHQADYIATQNPNHSAAGFSTACSDCHLMDAVDWSAQGINHDFFPLKKGHDINDCNRCHTGSDYSKTSPECITCHEQDYLSTTIINHPSLGLSTDCASCHTTDPGWTPAKFEQHDAQFFPIYSGAHHEAWSACMDCHTDPANYADYTCITCHTNPETNNEHNQVSGYSYHSPACLACHPTGDKEGTFNHNNTNFPLNGAHTTVECISCHANGYGGTPTNCEACHTTDYNESINPNHQSLGLSTDCATCHTTAPDWNPARFDVHDQYYVLQGAHLKIANECITCHQGDYNNTPNTCVGCHQGDYNQTTNPSHVAAQFSTDCAACHSETTWSPATFDHDNQYFPIYSGSHEGQWSECIDCHTTPGYFTTYNCITCHANPETNEQHQGVSGYAYNSTACLACHPTGDGQSGFDHNTTQFPLTGVHATTDCQSCHSNGYEGTPTQCVACHQTDFNQSTNPNHNSLGFSTDCAGCHTTNPDWEPAQFDLHNQYYVLSGAHAAIASECITCHNGDYTNTPNTCSGCHLQDYNQTTNPSHTTAQFSTDCASCHTESAWIPSTFDHDNQYFPIYSGKHEGEWNQCSDCHTSPGDYSVFTCITCHTNPETNEDHNGVSGYVYNSTACLSCHPTGNENGFNHNLTNFALTGAHLAVDCIECHSNGYAGTPTECVACHEANYQSSVNPSHTALGVSTDCVSCHTTAPGWAPASFATHNQYYLLSGAHAVMATECITCHNGDYNNTPNTCVGCHQSNYNQTLNPSHVNLQLPVDCASCHSESSWTPASFSIHNDYYPLVESHAIIASECVQCHQGNYNNTPNTCAGCHQDNYNATNNPPHATLQFSVDCATCHTQTNWSPATLNNHDDYYPLTGAHAVIATDCAQCHNGDYNNTPNTCVGCHLDDYTATNNPPHTTTGFGTDCASCHTENGWVPANFNHDAQYFPIYSGDHQGVWDQCSDCHSNPNNFSIVTCITCHTNPETDNQHQGIDGYAYNSSLCLACHPTGDAQGVFDHNTTNFPLTGSHNTVDCLACHANGFAGTPTECVSCHQADYNQSSNPNHVSLGLSTDCVTCHTTQPEWNPATFSVHNQFYELLGAHAIIANQCITCHNGDYNNTPNTCVGCHQSDYNQTNNPPHSTLQFSTDCATCHTQSAWSPASFADHDNQYFPIYSGGHEGTWDQCSECHTNPSNYSVYTCISCHTNPETNQDHAGVNGYIYQNSACLACHPTGEAAGAFDHATSNFPLTGAHLTVDCAECHANGYQNTPTECDACHIQDYNQSVNPSHTSLGLSTDCISCHTTDPNWDPALFPDHNNYYALVGAHAAIANQCATCHNGNYNNTPNTCAGCHIGDYNQTNDPDHQAANFPTTCETCHSQNNWVPSTWDHDDQYFPIFSGKHEDEWDQCSDCHTNPSNYAVFTCLTCHQPGPTNSDHNGVNGYQYNSAACYACHPNGEED